MSRGFDLAEIDGPCIPQRRSYAIVLAQRACRWLREKIDLHPPSCCLGIVCHRTSSTACLPPAAAWSKGISVVEGQYLHLISFTANGQRVPKPKSSEVSARPARRIWPCAPRRASRVVWQWLRPGSADGCTREEFHNPRHTTWAADIPMAAMSDRICDICRS